jgi:hypothetical protein
VTRRTGRRLAGIEPARDGVLKQPFETQVTDGGTAVTAGDGDRPDPAAKDTSEWVTGGEPMTAAQDSYLHTLAREAGEEVPAELTKAEASDLIDELQQRTGRGGGSEAR